ncbi:HEAT repeat domain-containing protein, partial [Limnoraphis robusta CCNP1324]|uniref:HEAT repeat domain-containing protein n=1 Tax=Limnoraphis robusta TaxID=1118279 RepID=UPI002B1F71DE
SNAASALGNIGNAEAVKPLIAALNDSESDVRSNAASALGNIGNAEAVKPLIAALNDSESDVRSNAASALGNIGDENTLKMLIESWEIDIYRRDIFPVARTLAIRFNQNNLPFIPVYRRFVRFNYSPTLAIIKRVWSAIIQQ